eukprot:scaffold1143_cov177-Amphora_coffeaeformis.AAC.3
MNLIPVTLWRDMGSQTVVHDFHKPHLGWDETAMDRARLMRRDSDDGADGADKEINVSREEIGNEEERESPIRFYLDMAVMDEPIGRLVFYLPRPKSVFPLHTDNLLQLVKQSRRSIDPACHYIKCQFNFSPQYIQGLPQYRWAHVLTGRNRNAIGRPTERVVDTAALQSHSHKLYGGIYYGLSQEEIVNDLLPPMYGQNENDPEDISASTTTLTLPLLTLPMTGPGRGYTQLTIVRVAESPQEWRERLLLNSAVIGWLEPQSMAVLQTMATQQRGPPTVVDSGILEDTDL